MLHHRHTVASALLALAVTPVSAQAGTVQIAVQDDVMTSGFFTGTDLVRGYDEDDRATHRVSTPGAFGVAGAETIYYTFDAGDFATLTGPIDSAYLTVTSISGGFGADGDAANPFTVSAHALSADPLSTITDNTNPAGPTDWVSFYNGNVLAAEAEAITVIDSFGQVQFDITAIVNDWVDGSNTVFAVALTGNNDTSGGDFLHGFVNNSETPGSSFLTVTTVPEPGSMALLASGALLLCRRRRQCRFVSIRLLVSTLHTARMDGQGELEMKTLTRTLFAACAAALLGSVAQAQVTTDPYLFEAPSFGAADGTFEWDTFVGAFAGPHATDVGTTGTGSASLGVIELTPDPTDGPPFGILTSSSNLYSGGNTGTYGIDLTGLDASEAFTTVVLQIAYIPGSGPFAATLQLDGVDATQVVDRGIADGVLHGLVASPNDTAYLWAEWQVAAGSDYTLTFDTVNHTNLAAVRIDYVNSGSVVDAIAPSAVPEPSALALLLGGAALCGVRRRR